MSDNSFYDFYKASGQVLPSSRQLAWFDTEFYAFIHFGVNTFTNKEWGDGNEPESIFSPKKLDCRQWCMAAKSAGMKGIILTAKHHDGFCLWPSLYTEHCVKNSPVKRDIVGECAAACKESGLKFGIYLSPWDRNSKLYGSPAYNDYFCNQLEELLTHYGDIFCVWFDNACGEGPNGKKQEYDFPRYIELIRRLQPGAVIFNDYGPDVRWCGNEGGEARLAEWAVVPSELCKWADVQTGAGPLCAETRSSRYDSGYSMSELNYLYCNNQQLGETGQILQSKGLVFCPSEINMSIRPGWFHHPNESPHSLERLFKTYITSVGHNACFNLNLPPDKGGLISDYDVKRLKELGDLIRQEFGNPDYVFENPVTVSHEPVGENKTAEEESAASDIAASTATAKCGSLFEFKFSSPTKVKYVIVEEDIAKGQRVESFQFEPDWGEECWRFPLYSGRTIGHKQICIFNDPFDKQNPLTRINQNKFNSIKLRVTASRGLPLIKSVKVFAEAEEDEDEKQEVENLAKYAHEKDIPIMKEDGSDFICDYIKKNNVKNILEIGTAIGYSTMKFARIAPDIKVTSIEIDTDRYNQAVKNVHEAGLDRQITLYLADATQLELPQGSLFDLIFIDGPKAQYIPLFQKYSANLAEGGAIISDNLSFHGMVEDLSLTHNYSTIKLVKKIRRYIDFLKGNEGFETEFIKLGDGISVSRRVLAN